LEGLFRSITKISTLKSFVASQATKLLQAKKLKPKRKTSIHPKLQTLFIHSFTKGSNEKRKILAPGDKYSRRNEH
jgi:hypothetical protein